MILIFFYDNFFSCDVALYLKIKNTFLANLLKTTNTRMQHNFGHIPPGAQEKTNFDVYRILSPFQNYLVNYLIEITLNVVVALFFCTILILAICTFYYVVRIVVIEPIIYEFFKQPKTLDQACDEKTD